MVTWETKTLDKIGYIITGNTPPTADASNYGNEYLWASPVDLGESKYITDTATRLTHKGFDKTRKLPKGSILVVCIGSTIGKVGIATQEMSTNQQINSLVCYDDYDNEYVFYALRDAFPRHTALVATQAVPIINKGQFSTFEIKLPDKPEQRRIATALSDTDALITALERLIAKKRAVKQGAMQELLTGKRRLPGFEGEWAERPLGDFGYCVRGVSYSPDADLFSFGNRNAIVLLRANNIVDGKLEFDNVQFVRKSIVSEEQTLAVGDIVIAMSSGSVIAIGKTGTYIGYSEPCCIGAFCAIFRSEYNEYIRFLFQSPMYREQLQTVLEGTSINNLNGKIVEGLIFTFPSDTREIDAIAEILSDMDAEIDTLKAKLNKLRNIKQGMMSELLTGRIRLADSQAAKATVEVYPEQATESIRKVAEDTTSKGHNQQFDDAVMIAGIVNVLYSDRFPLGRKKVQKCLYLLRRYQDESTAAFKKKAAGPYADEVRYKGGEPIAKGSKYITTTTDKKGTTFACGDKINQALGYIESWDRQADIQWVADNLRFKKVDDLELLATVDMAICDLTEAGTPVTVQSIKHLIATNAEWKAKLKKQTFSDKNITRAMQELQTLLQGGKTNG